MKDEELKEKLKKTHLKIETIMKILQENTSKKSRYKRKQRANNRNTANRANTADTRDSKTNAITLQHDDLL